MVCSSSFFFFFFVTGICVQFLSYTAFSAVGIRARLSVFAFFLSECPQMLKSILGTNCDVDRLVPWLRRGPMRVPLFFPKPGVRWSKMCTGQPSFCVPFGFYFFLGLFSLIFEKAGVFVGSSVVVPPVFRFFSLFTMSIRFWFCFLFLPSSPFSSSAFIMSSFLLRMLISLSFSGGFLVTEVFSFLNFNLCTGCQGVKMSF